MVKNLHKLFALVLLCCAFFGSSSVANGQEITYEPFNYTLGTNLGGQGGWVNVNSGDEVIVASGNLSYGNLKESAGSLVSFSGAGIDPQLQLPNSISSGWVYYSFIFRVTDLSAVGTATTDATYFAGLGSGTSGFAAAVWVRKAGEGFNVGFSKRSNSEVTWQPEVYTIDQNIFIAGAYNLISGTANDFAKVWINPAESSIGGNEPTPTTETAITGTDLNSIDRFFLRQDNNFKTPGIDFDELRVGTTWASVTPVHVQTTAPTISSSVTAIDLGEQLINTNLTGSYTISGRNLSGNVTLTASTPIQISKTADAGFGSSLTFAAAELQTEQTIYVRATSATVGALSGTVTHSSEGANDVVLSIMGSFASPYAQDFSNCGTSLPGGWTAQNVTGDQVWGCTTFGRSNNAVQINGFSSGSKNNEDWLISPAMNLSGFGVPVLSFWTRSAFVGPAMKVMVSTNYDGTSAPSTATWTQLNVSLPEVGSDVWTMSEALLDAYKQASVHVAFVYTSIEQANGSSRWTLDDFAVTDEPRKLIASNATFDFGAHPAWQVNAAEYVTFKALGFTEDIVIDTNHPDFEVSKDNVNFAQSVTYTAAEAAAGEELFVRFLPKSTFLGIKSVMTATSGAGFKQDLGTLTGSSIPKSTTLDIVTWNVEWFGADKDGDGRILGPSDDALQYQNVKKAIEILDADIYALQEIANDKMMEDMVAEMPGYSFVRSDVFSYSIRPANFESTPQKLYFVYKNATVKVKNEKVLLESLYKDLLANTTTLPNYPGSSTETANDDAFWASGRLPYMVEFEVNIEGVTQRIHALNLHARANSGTNTTVVAQRRYDLQVLKDSLDVQYPNINLIMLGDYNDDVDVSVVGTNQPSTYDIFVNDAKYNVLTYDLSLVTTEGTYNRSSFLDHISVSSRLTKGYIEESIRIEESLYNAIPRYHTTTSDHAPVSARFYLSATPLVKFSAASVTKTEGDEKFNVTLTITEAQPEAQTVTISIAENATTSASDYTITGASDGSVTVTVPANATTATFEVSITDDTTVEATEEVTFVISNTGNLLGIGSERNFKLTIQDNDKTAVSFAMAEQQVNEDAGTVTVTLNFSSALLQAEQFMVNVTNGTAVTYGAEGDYTTTPAVTNNTIAIEAPAGATSATFTVGIINDTVVENPETVTFALANLGDRLMAGETATYALTIQDDDKAAISFSASALEVTEDAGEFTITLELDQASMNEETIKVSVNSSTATSADFTTTPAATDNMISLTIPAGATTATFVVNIIDDTIVEGTEVISFELANPSAGLKVGTEAAFTVTILDNDKTSVSFALAEQEVNEDAGTVTVTLNLSNATVKEEQIVINVTNGTGVVYGAEGDYTSTPAVADNKITVAVPAGVTTANFTVTVIDDTNGEDLETITFALGSLSDGLKNGEKVNYALTIVDNEEPAGIADATKGQFSVYPNPAIGPIRLLLPERIAVQSKVSLVIYSLEGKKALTVSGTLADVQEQLQVKSANLTNGMYIVLVEAGKEYFQTKLIKQ